jgi:drug/metabolite transporter (DMT)-like permease
MRLAFLTAFTLIAFAANSLLCRMALGGHFIDPVSFTTLRLGSGAVALVALARVTAATGSPGVGGGTWVSGAALFVYALAFSLAYLSLSAGTGALILFASVQVTMIGAALRAGERLTLTQWLGSLAAMGGLVYLVLPGIAAPDLPGAVLMGASGISWGLYSLRGRGSPHPVAMTAGNFARSAPLALAASAVAFAAIHLQPRGVLLALVSGMLTSGVGYVLWYTALRSLTTTQASLVQLAVPVLAAFGGLAFLSERLSFRLVMASILILGGVALAVTPRRPLPAASRA